MNKSTEKLSLWKTYKKKVDNVMEWEHSGGWFGLVFLPILVVLIAAITLMVFLSLTFGGWVWLVLAALILISLFVWTWKAAE